MFFVKLLASFLLSIEVREQAQTMWIAMGEGGSCNVHFTNKAYLVKLFTKGEGGGHKSPKNCPHGLCMPPILNGGRVKIMHNVVLHHVFCVCDNIYPAY